MFQEKENPYDVPISMGIFKLLESPLDITTSTIIKRIVSNHDAYQVLLKELNIFLMQLRFL